MADSEPETSKKLSKPESDDKISYPHGIWFILSNEFCERFNFYGGRAVLTLFLVEKLKFSENDSTVIFHSSYALTYLMALLGGILADNVFGKYHTIWAGSVIYVIGTLLLSFSAIPNIAGAVGICFFSLVLIAIGSGGIKPCVSSFGGEQFKLPEQNRQLDSFFQLFYFMINFGSLLATIITPIARDDVYCYGESNCYPLAFFIPAVLMTIALVIFFVGTPLYIIKNTYGNSLVDVSLTIKDAIIGKLTRNKTEPPKLNWLLYAHPKHDFTAIRNAKVLCGLCFLYIPLPLFWTLFDQQSSRWTLQQTYLDNEVGPYRISAGHMHVLNPLLVMILIPVFKFAIYPVVERIGINSPLRKLICGGCLAGVAFFASFLLESAIFNSKPELPAADEAHFRMYNGLPCAFDVEILEGPKGFEGLVMDILEMDEKLDFQGLNETISYDITIIPSEDSPDEDATIPRCTVLKSNLTVIPGKATGYFITSEGTSTKLIQFDDSPARDHIGRVILRVLTSFEQNHMLNMKEKDQYVLRNVTNLIKTETIPVGTYQILIDDENLITCNGTKDFKLKGGGVYVIVVTEIKANDFKCAIFVITEPNSINVLWQIPQFLLITMGEIMFSITGLEFSFTEAPASLKSTITAIWLITVALGNIIVVIFAKLRLFEEQLWEYLMFAVFIWIDMTILAYLAWQYKSVPIDEQAWIKELKEEEKLKKSKN